MPRLEGSLHGLKANPSARANNQDCRHGVILASTHLAHVICDAGSRTARWAGRARGGTRRLLRLRSWFNRAFQARANGVNGISKSESPWGVVRWAKDLKKHLCPGTAEHDCAIYDAWCAPEGAVLTY